MNSTFYVSHGMTESGDQMPLAIWRVKPSAPMLANHYKDLIPEEFEAFGEDYVVGLIEVDEAPVV